MCCKRDRARSNPPIQPASYPYDGETVSLEQFAHRAPTATLHQCSAHAHYWHLLWLLVPLIVVGKWLLASTVLAVGTLWQMLWQPLVQDVSLLPLLLIVAGVLLLLHNSAGDRDSA